VIRAITLGVPLFHHSTDDLGRLTKTFGECATRIAAAAGTSVRTFRLSLPPVGPEHENRAAIGSLLRAASDLAEDSGMRWFCLPIDLTVPGANKERIAAALAGIRSVRKMFVNCMVADGERMAAAAIRDVARLIIDVSKQSNNGFDNFRVGASCSCPPHAPFFPFARHAGPLPAFSIALETTRLAQQAVAEAAPGSDLAELRGLVYRRLQTVLTSIEQLGHELERVSGVEYKGLDASFAPFPDGSASVARLVEAMSGAPVGAAGTLFVTSALTDTLRAAIQSSGATPIGFNGVMYSVLEDDHLATANSRRALSIEGLMAFSAVCGCGLDMIPLPGSTFPEEIAATLLDVAALSSRLGKPLGLRLLPIPGKVVNEIASFNLDFLCDSRIMELRHTDKAPVSAGSWAYLASTSGGLSRARGPT
jgi:uncharacterized protein